MLEIAERARREGAIEKIRDVDARKRLVHAADIPSVREKNV